jgi:hypothetical protein
MSRGRFCKEGKDDGGLGKAFFSMIRHVVVIVTCAKPAVALSLHACGLPPFAHRIVAERG